MNNYDLNFLVFVHAYSGNLYKNIFTYSSVIREKGFCEVEACNKNN
jgi:hypothetical protein